MILKSKISGKWKIENNHFHFGSNKLCAFIRQQAVPIRHHFLINHKEESVMKRSALVLCFLMMIFSFFATAQASTIYSNNFSTSAGPEWSNTTRSTANGETYLGQFGNGTVTLTLSGLTVGSSATVDFDLYIIQSWDGNGYYGPDNWYMAVNGKNVVDTSFANYIGYGATQDYPNIDGTGASNPNRTGATATNHLGYGGANENFGDTTYHLSIAVDKIASSTLTIDFTSGQNQAVGDEGWGLDNVSVSATPVPVPPSLFLLVPGFFGLVAMKKRIKI
jgi:hypothetical protein